MRKLVVGALIGGTALVGGGTAAQAFDDAGGFDSGGYDSGGFDSGGYDSGGGGISDFGGFDAGSLDSGTADFGGFDAGSLDAGYADVGSYDTGGFSDVGAYDTGSFDSGSFDTGGDADAGGVSDFGGFDAGSLDSGTPDFGGFDAGSLDAGSSDTGSDATGFTDDLGGYDTGSFTAAEPTYATTVTDVDEVTTEVGGEDGSATGGTWAGTPTDHVDPTDGLTDDASGTYTTTHQVGTETETVAPTTVDGWFSGPEAATSTTTTFAGTETVQETGIPSIGTDGAVAGSIEESWDSLDVTETTTTVAPLDGDGWTTTQVDREEHGPGWGLDLDPTDGTLEASATYQGEISSSYDAGQDLGSWSLGTGYDLTAGADATVEATLDHDSIGFDLGIEGTASASGHAGVTVGEDTFAETELTGTATVEAEAQAGAEVDLGLTEGSGDIGLFGGVSGTVEAEGEVAGVTGTVGLTGSVGAGAGAGFDYSAEDGVYSFSGHVHGAAVIGGGVSGGITVDTGELAESAGQAWDAAATAVSDGWSSFTSTVGGFFGGRD